jgi:hypothetical protein
VVQFRVITALLELLEEKAEQLVMESDALGHKTILGKRHDVEER